MTKKFSFAFDLLSIERFNHYFRLAIADFYLTGIDSRALFLYETGCWGTKLDILFLHIVREKNKNAWTQ